MTRQRGRGRPAEPGCVCDNYTHGSHNSSNYTHGNNYTHGSNNYTHGTE